MKVRFDKPELADPTRDRGIKVPYAPGRRQLARWRWYLILLVCSSPLLYFIAKLAHAGLVIDAPGFISHEQIAVRAFANGYVDEILVKPLDTVEAGAALAKLSNQGLEARQDQIRAELRALGEVEAETDAVTPPPLLDFQEQINITEEQREYHRQRMETLRQLVEEGAATEAELAAANSQYQEASSKIAELRRAMSQNEQMQRQPSSPNQQIRTRVATLRSELISVGEQLGGLVVLAPKAGRVMDVSVVRGDQLAVGGKVLMLAPGDGQMRISVYLAPRDADYATPGRRATVIFADGQRRLAQITDVPEVAQQVPVQRPELFADREVGVLVRMQFVDGDSTAYMTDGLPVKVRFEGAEGPALVQIAGQQVRSAWNSLKQLITGV